MLLLLLVVVVVVCVGGGGGGEVRGRGGGRFPGCLVCSSGEASQATLLAAVLEAFCYVEATQQTTHR